MASPTRHDAPLTNPAFRAIWLASIFSFIGTWVQDVGQSWLMLSMSRDPMWVAALSMCALGPGLLLTLPAGLLADRSDRRKILLYSQAVQALAAAAPAVAARAGVLHPGVLLGSAAVLGLAMTVGAPAWATLVPELLPRRKITEAITLGSIAFNIARVVGPALGGLLLALAGAEVTFVVNALSFLAVLWVLARYPEVKAASEAPRKRETQRLAGALLEPFRTVRRSGALRGAFASAGAFLFSASVAISILPAFAKHSLGASASGYGALLSALGCGAIASGLLLSHARARFGVRAVVAAGTAIYGLGMLLAALAPSVLVALPLFFLAGLGWLACLSTLAATVQLSVAAESKSRVMALYQLDFYALATIGAALGGVIATHVGERGAIALGGLGSVLSAVLAARTALPAATTSETEAEAETETETGSASAA
ncbi:MAG TPA: MFS transporter [Polyangiaceae bacterium]|nr:MFS transporter [Polyangiaceae bacterium]